MWYLERLPLYATEKPYTMRYEPDGGIPQTNFQKVQRPMTVKSMREFGAGPFHLGECGFQRIELRSRLTSDEFWDNDKVQGVYIQEVKDALKRELGAKYVHVLDYAVCRPPSDELNPSWILIIILAQVRKRHESFPVSTGEEYEYDQPTALAHIGMINVLDPIQSPI
jgi:hypothetical protein